jgi:hypothetical protein
MLCRAGVAITCLAVAGCAHHQNQYAYAPPLAPPVYPQPQPVAAPAVSVPHPTQPGVMPPAAVPGPMPPVTMAPGVECCPPLGPGEVVVSPVVYQEGQSPACPPGP